MLVKNVILLLALAGALPLAGCSQMAMENPFTSDPLTGGQNATTSILLGVPIPAGMQRYASHGYISSGMMGERKGLETYRGNVDQGAAAMTMNSGLASAGWNLRMQNSKGDRAIHVYENGKNMAAIVFHRQGILTIMEIWQSPRLEDGAAMPRPEEENITPSIAGEEYGPLNAPVPATPGKTESWGNKNLEEKDI